MSLLSYKNHGHDIYLFTYDKVKNVPNGIEIVDGNEIISKDKIFSYDNSYSNFSDIFRYAVMQKRGFFWTDLDSICVSNNWSFRDEYVFGVNDKYNLEEYVCTSNFKLPQQSEILDYLVKKSQNFEKSDSWAPAGPKLLTEAVFKYELKNKILPPEAFSPIHFTKWHDFWNPEKVQEVRERVSRSYSFQLWNQMINRSQIDRDIFPNGSYLHNLYKNM